MKDLEPALPLIVVIAMGVVGMVMVIVAHAGASSSGGWEKHLWRSRGKSTQLRLRDMGLVLIILAMLCLSYMQLMNVPWTK